MSGAEQRARECSGATVALHIGTRSSVLTATSQLTVSGKGTLRGGNPTSSVARPHDLMTSRPHDLTTSRPHDLRAHATAIYEGRLRLNYASDYLRFLGSFN